MGACLRHRVTPLCWATLPKREPDLPPARPSSLPRSAHAEVRDPMLIVDVLVRVRPEHVDAFIAATLANARASLLEPGVVRFDVAQQQDDASQFLLIEIYRTAEDPARHKATSHYATWRDAVEPMMAEPRRSTKYHALLPDDTGR